MIKQSFIFLPSISHSREKALWHSGISDWNDFLSAKDVAGMSTGRKLDADALIGEARKQLFLENSSFFGTLLPTTEHYRLYEQFRDNAAFVDIETNYRRDITMIGIYDGNETKTFVKSHNLDRKAVLDEFAKYKLLVTFNGLSFDMPIISNFFGVKFDLPHVDLRTVCRRLGYVGGLKTIEADLNISRRDDVVGMTGMDAARLWHEYRESGDKELLDKIIMYNEEDIVNLKTIADRLIPKLWENVKAGKSVIFPKIDEKSENPPEIFE